MLEGDGHLINPVELAPQYVDMAEGCLAIDVDTAVPSATTAPRHQLTLDSAFAIVIRKYLRSLIDNGEQFFIFVVADSSPRAGKECSMCEFYSVKAAQVERVWEPSSCLMAIVRREMKATASS